MRIFRLLSGLVLGVACAVPLHGARAQITFDAPGVLVKPPPPGPPEVRAQPLAWPRLDRGAVLCRTEEDLQRLAANRRGGPGGGTVDCRIISQPTAIQIVQRKGPGRTEVQVTAARGQKTGETGWTDVWLPDKAPVGGAATSR